MARKETVRARPPAEEDMFGDPAGDDEAWVDIPGTTVVPRESSEYQQRGQIIIHGFMLRLPAPAVVGDNWEFEVRGEVFQVDGAIGDFGRKGKIVYVGRAN